MKKGRNHDAGCALVHLAFALLPAGGAPLRRREAATHTKADIHEADSDYLARCRQTAREAAAFYGWTVISCARDGKLRTKEDIHQEIFDQVFGIISL